MTEKTDKLVNSILDGFKQARIEALPYDAVATVFRPYLHWLHKARSDREEPDVVRGVVIHLLSSMIVEASLCIKGTEEDGSKTPIEVWLGEVMLSLRDSIITDLDNMDPKKSSH